MCVCGGGGSQKQKEKTNISIDAIHLYMLMPTVVDLKKLMFCLCHMFVVERH